MKRAILLALVAVLVAAFAGCGERKPSDHPINVTSTHYRITYDQLVNVVEHYGFFLNKADVDKGIVGTEWLEGRDYATNRLLRRRVVATVYTTGSDSYDFEIKVFKQMALGDEGHGSTPESEPEWSAAIPDVALQRLMTNEAIERIKRAD